jgi:hypothetical protein
MIWAAVALMPGRLLAQAEEVKDGVSKRLASVGFRGRNNLEGSMGTDPMWRQASFTGKKPTSVNLSDDQPKMKLTQEEQEILDGKKGPLKQKAMKTIVAYGELFSAEKLVDLDHAPHIAMSWGTDAIIPFLKIYEQFADAGIKTYALRLQKSESRAGKGKDLPGDLPPGWQADRGLREARHDQGRLDLRLLRIGGWEHSQTGRQPLLV